MSGTGAGEHGTVAAGAREHGTAAGGGAVAAGTAGGGAMAARAGGLGAVDGSPASRRRPGRRWAAAGFVVVVVAAAVAVARVSGNSGRAGSPAPGAGGYKTSTALVTQRSLTSQTQVPATLGNSGSYSVVNQAAGTITWLPAIGSVVHQGQVLYRVSGSPVVLLYGRVPAYRDLSEGMTGADVTELNAGLVRLGYATAAALGPRSGWDYFSAETAYALEQLQAKLGLTVTGSLPLGQAAFLPAAAQVTGVSTGVVPGTTAQPGTVVLTASSTRPIVTIGLDASQQTEVKTGDHVMITLPDGTTTPGVVSQVAAVAMAASSSADSGSGSSASSGSGSSATITVLVALTDPKAAGHLNQAPVEVTITTGSVSGVLVVPVNALLAQPGGGYAVEVTGPRGHHLVAVVPGLFDDAAGLVQVSGPGLAAGQRVVVPGL